jgi:hypothetical protein
MSFNFDGQALFYADSNQLIASWKACTAPLLLSLPILLVEGGRGGSGKMTLTQVKADKRKSSAFMAGH